MFDRLLNEIAEVRSLSAAKGLAPIVIVIIIAVIGIGIFALFSSRNSQQSNTTGQQSAKTPEQALQKSQNLINQGLAQITEKVEDDSYIFYYPKGYSKVDPGKNYKLMYQNPNTKAVAPERIFFGISSKTYEPSTVKVDFQSCTNLGEGLRAKADDDIKAETVSGNATINGAKGSGCKVTIKSKVKGTDDAIVVVTKTLWNPDKTDYAYSAGTEYYDLASKDQTEILNTAVDAFTLK